MEREGDEERSATTWKTEESDVAGETRESGAGVQVAVVAEAETEREMRREKREMEVSGRLEKCRDGRKGLEEKVQVAICLKRRDEAQTQLIIDTSDKFTLSGSGSSPIIWKMELLDQPKYSRL